MKRRFLNLLLLPLLIMLLLVAGSWLWPKKKHITLQEAVKNIAAKKLHTLCPNPHAGIGMPGYFSLRK